MPGPAVLLSHVGNTYHEGDSERIVLRDVSVAIAPREIAVLVGRSGSGKSTLLNLIAGIDRPTAGRCWSTAPTSPRSTRTRAPGSAGGASASS